MPILISIEMGLLKPPKTETATNSRHGKSFEQTYSKPTPVRSRTFYESVKT